jgi:hypothetical protein
MAELVDRDQPLTDAELRQFEALFCRALPDSFRLHRLLYVVEGFGLWLHLSP